MLNPIYKTFLLLCCGAALFVFANCNREPQMVESDDYRDAKQITLIWNKFVLEIERHTPGFRPPVSARTFAYIEMAAYEASLPGMDGYISLENYCPAYKKTEIREQDYNLPLALNAAYARIIYLFFPTAPRQLLAQIPHIEAENNRLIQQRLSANTLTRNSVDFGQKIAESVWRFSILDTVGHNGFLNNYDRKFVPQSCAGCWQPVGNSDTSALLPYWGEARPFVVNCASPEMIAKAPPVWDDQPGSALYTEAMEVFSVSQALSKEEVWIAEFWSDDLPGFTVTPAGRWLSITNQAMEKRPQAFPEMMETYLKVSLSLCDAGIVCWSNKYRYHLARPQTIICQKIDPNWKPLHDNPNFPAYPSGHSMFGASAAEVLTSQFGEHFELTDRTHEDRPEFASNPRTFDSFAAMAQENALSRVFIGVHYRIDCQEGLRIGKIIGQKVNALPLKVREASLVR